MGWLQDLLSGYSEGVVSEKLGGDFRAKQRAAASELETDQARRALLGTQNAAGVAGIDTEKLKQEAARASLAEQEQTQAELARLAGAGALPSASREASDIASTVEGRRASTRASNANAALHEVQTGTPEEYKAQRDAALRKDEAEIANTRARTGLVGAQRGLIGQAGPTAERQKIVETYAKLSADQGKAFKPPAATEKRFPGISDEVMAAWQGMGPNATSPLANRNKAADAGNLTTAIGTLDTLLQGIDAAPTRTSKLATANTFTEMASGVGGIVARAIEKGRVSDQDRAVYTQMIVPLQELKLFGQKVGPLMLQVPAYRKYAQERLKIVKDLFGSLSDRGSAVLRGEDPDAAGAAGGSDLFAPGDAGAGAQLTTAGPAVGEQRQSKRGPVRFDGTGWVLVN